MTESDLWVTEICLLSVSVGKEEYNNIWICMKF